MYINNLIIKKKPLFDSSFTLFFFKTSCYFCQMIKKNLAQVNFQWKDIIQPKKIIIINIITP